MGNCDFVPTWDKVKFIFASEESMKAVVIKSHPGEGLFPEFEQGTPVTLKEACTHFLHWYACEIQGYDTYVPTCFVRDGVLTRRYNPTELVQEEGDLIEVREIVYAWLLATNKDGITGWIPAESVISCEGE
jgi:hypothetical protein